MPITTKHGSIFDSKAAVLVCPVNCVGVMGKGLALEFKRRIPAIMETYKQLCNTNCFHPGDSVYLVAHHTIVAATKGHWRDSTRIEWVDSCLADIARKPFCSIAIPQLGCGCGGLDWADVWPLYERHLGGLDCDVEVWIYE